MLRQCLSGLSNLIACKKHIIPFNLIPHILSSCKAGVSETLIFLVDEQNFKGTRKIFMTIIEHNMYTGVPTAGGSKMRGAAV